MGLIKKNQIHDKGTVIIDEPVPVVSEETKVAVSSLPPAAQTVVREEDLTKVQSEAQKIIEQAKNEAGQVTEQARQEGFEAGKAEASTRLEEAMQTLNEAVNQRKQIIKDAENEILRLAIKIAEQIIKSEVSLHRDVCLNIVTEAIARVSDREQIIVRVNREDAEFLKRYKDRLAGMLDGVRSFSILEDNNIEPGGCVIETNLGYIDGKISTKLKALELALNKVASEETNTSDES